MEKPTPKKYTKHGRRLVYKAANAARRRNTRKEKGLCIDCGDHPAEPGSALCSIHKAKRAETATRDYHAKRLKKANLAPHEYDLRVQLAGGKCEGCSQHPITHFNFCPYSKKLRMLVCKRCDHILHLLNNPGAEDHLIQLLKRLATFHNEMSMAVVLTTERNLPLVHTALSGGANV